MLSVIVFAKSFSLKIIATHCNFALLCLFISQHLKMTLLSRLLGQSGSGTPAYAHTPALWLLHVLHVLCFGLLVQTVFSLFSSSISMFEAILMMVSENKINFGTE